MYLVLIYMFAAHAVNGLSNERADLFNLDSISKTQYVPRSVRAEAFQILRSSNQRGIRSQRSGHSTSTHNCDQILNLVPSHLTFITKYNFYSKYTHAYGIPVVSSSAVSDAALKRACYIVRFLYADRKDVRESMYKHFGRVGVIAINEQTTTIPEFRHLSKWWDTRARGLGGVLGRAISTGGEENLLCLKNDRYRGDDIFFHESAHGVAEVAIKGGGIPGFYNRLLSQFNYVKRLGLWRNTYSMTDSREYFAEGAQSFFNCHVEAIPTNNIHNHVNTRAELKQYDRGLYDLLNEVFPCMNTYHTCTANPPDMRMDCGQNTTWPSTTISSSSSPVMSSTVTSSPVTKADCEDKSRFCKAWARHRNCEDRYVKAYCKKTCNLCPYFDEN